MFASEVDVWVEVFKYLTYKELKEVSLVCHLFNEIVSENLPRFFKRTKLFIKLNDIAKEDPNWKLSSLRRYQRVKLMNGQSKVSQHEIQHIEKFGDDRFANLNIQIAIISHHLIDLEIKLDPVKPKDLLELLKCCQSLEKLKFLANSPVQLKRGETLESIKFNKLKSLTFEDSSEWILDHFDITELDELDITHDGNEDFDSSTCCMKSIVNFINKLTRLDSLALDDIDWDHCDELDVKFKWKNLLIGCDSEDYCGTFSSTGIENLEKLCKSSGSEGKAQFFLYYQKIPQRILHNIISYCSCIERLSFCAEGLPAEDAIARMNMEGLKTLNNLEIRTHRSGQSLQSIEIRLIAFLSRIPKIRKLSIYGNAASMLTQDICQQYFSEVYTLLLKKIDETSQNLVFPKLDYLEVEQIKETRQFEFLRNFGRNNPTIKTAEMFWSKPQDYERREQLLNQLYNAMNKVQKFKIGFLKTLYGNKSKKKEEFVTGERNAMELKHFGRVLSDAERDSGNFTISI